jgi:hypothetical protein
MNAKEAGGAVRRLVLTGGDGDQSYLGTPIELQIVEREWFIEETLRGRATLAQILEGSHRGKYVALTSRVLASIGDQLAEQGSASVVINVVRHPGPEYRPTLDNLDAVGMGFIELAG